MRQRAVCGANFPRTCCLSSVPRARRSRDRIAGRAALEKRVSFPPPQSECGGPYWKKASVSARAELVIGLPTSRARAFCGATPAPMKQPARAAIRLRRAIFEKSLVSARAALPSSDCGASHRKRGPSHFQQKPVQQPF